MIVARQLAEMTAEDTQALVAEALVIATRLGLPVDVQELLCIRERQPWSKAWNSGGNAAVSGFYGLP